METTPDATREALAALFLQVEWGADEALEEAPVDRFASLVPVLRPAAILPGAPAPRLRAATGAAPPPKVVDAPDIAALHAMLDGLDHPLRRTAAHTVGPAGDPGTGLLLMADAPGADDDRSGKAFSGATGAVLDRVLGSAGLGRDRMVLAFLVPWRPPGGRPPSTAEIDFCLPFARRLLALTRPRRLVLVGNQVWAAMTGETGGRRGARGRWTEIAVPGGAAVPALSLRPPTLWLHDAAAKRDTWAGLLALRAALHD